MQPESSLFGKHNTDRIATEALNEAAEQELSKRTHQALEHPDAIEQSKVNSLAQEKNLLEDLDLNLSINTGETITTERRSSFDGKAEAKLFQPHDKAESSLHPGVEFATSVIGFDLKEEYTDTDDEHENTGQLLLIKLDHGDADMTAKDLKLGTNCRFGAFIREGGVQPFVIGMTQDDREEQRRERRDPTEERGFVVEEKVVHSGKRERMQLNYLDPEQDATEHTAVRDEIKMFLQQRQQDA